MRRSRGRRHDAEDEVLRLLHEHAAELLRFARRFSLCADDAQDAYQRSLEILLRRVRSDPPEHPLRWLRTVIRHEAATVREQRLRDVDREELDLDRHEIRGFEDPADRAEQFEQLAHAAEAMRRLKPQEVTALALRAEGLSYREICRRTGWTYTRTNRAVTEGRRAFVARIRAIESGAECERWLPLLSLLADGEATARDLAELRPHLRGCRGCRATLRTFYGVPRQIGELVPAGLLPLAVAESASSGHGFGIGRHLEALVHTLSDRATAGAMRMQGALEALPASKMAAVAASTAAIAGGGVAIEEAATRDGAGARSAASVAAPSDRPPAGATLAPAVATTAPIASPSTGSPSQRGGPARSTAPSAGPTPGAEFGFEAPPVASRRQPARERPAAVTAAAASPAPPPRMPPAPRAPAEFTRHASPPAAAASPDPAPAPEFGP